MGRGFMQVHNRLIKYSFAIQTPLKEHYYNNYCLSQEADPPLCIHGIVPN
jgi:hypothetical protein